jgi:hypothetical protein
VACTLIWLVKPPGEITNNIHTMFDGSHILYLLDIWTILYATLGFLGLQIGQLSLKVTLF